ncbi:hypothetical protein VTI74DRAFT_9845 [Chaetomium olivicolor]
MPSSRRATRSPPRHPSDPPKSSAPPEILHQLGRAVLSYSLRKLSEQQKERSRSRQDGRSSSRPRPSRSRSKPRDPSNTSKRGSSGDLPRSDSGDMHSLISQLAVGIVAFGIRHIIRRRKEAKKQAAAAAAQSTATTAARGVGSILGQGQGQGAVDPELSVALDTVTKELQGATETIRRLASSAPSSHRDCAVRDALVKDAERLTGSLANIQASVHNMRNLHPGLDQERGQARVRTERRSRRERERGRERVEEGREKTRRRERAGQRERRGGEQIVEGGESIRVRERPEDRRGEVQMEGPTEERRARRKTQAREEVVKAGRERSRGEREQLRPTERTRSRISRWEAELEKGRRPLVER